MPICPQDLIFAVRDMSEIIKQVDEKLSQLVPPSRFSWGDPDEGMRCLRVVIEGTLTLGEKCSLKKLYEDAGWTKVIVKNSGDDGERPGLIGFRFYSSDI